MLLRDHLCPLGLSLAIGGLPAGALAAVTISSGTTNNMVCQGGVCAPTAKHAVLNVNDLETLLASGNVDVTSTGAGTQAEDVIIKSALSWSNASVLTLDAHRSLAIDRPVSIGGLAGLTLAYGAKGLLNFGANASATFSNLSSALTINGTDYTLVDTVKSLASAVAANPSGAYGFAADYDASEDGIWSSVPVPTTFTGTLEGLGHTISKLTIDDQYDSAVGLFSQIDPGAIVRDMRMIDARMTAEAGAVFGMGAFVGMSYGTLINDDSDRGTLHGTGGDGGSNVGGLVGIQERGETQEILNCSASGSVTNDGPEGSAGGLVGMMYGGTIVRSRSSASISSPNNAGGLVGFLVDASAGISQSFAAGPVSGTPAGGLVGWNDGLTTNTYSTGIVASSAGYLGGLAGVESDSQNTGRISASYSTGRVKRSGAPRGGLVGEDLSPGGITDTYWDLDTSGIANKSRGAGTPKNDTGITGLTTKQLKSGLPAGFDPSIWGENPKINGGLPYLLANLPR